MSDSRVVEVLRHLSAKPQKDQEWAAWLDAPELAATLKGLAGADWLVLYAGLTSVFIHTVAVSADRVTPPDAADLVRWSFGAHDNSWSTVVSFKPPAVRLEPPLTQTGTKTLERGTKLVYPRAFDGMLGETRYFELEPSFTHLMEIHFVSERGAWCRLDERGDVEPVVRIVRTERTAAYDGGTIILCKRTVLEEWMARTDTVLVQMFDLIRQRKDPVKGTIGKQVVREDGDLIFRFRDDSDAVVIRGVVLIRTLITNREMAEKLGATASAEKREYATFIAQDMRHGNVREISTEPGATANYFQKSDLPFETSPAFFRPEVLLRYKSDSDRYRMAHRSISCRGAWHLAGFDISEEGQVHAYIGDLARLPYDEQLHWKAHNENPNGPISKRAIAADFRGEFTDERDPLESVKHTLYEWNRVRVPWWALRSEKLPDQVQYTFTMSADEWTDDLLHLHQFIVEGFEEGWLRKHAIDLGRSPDLKVRSLKLLEQCLIGHGCDEDRSRAITAPFHQLNDLRVLKGHATGVTAADAKKDAIARHGSFAKHLRVLAEACDESLKTVGEILSAGQTPEHQKATE